MIRLVSVRIYFRLSTWKPTLDLRTHLQKFDSSISWIKYILGFFLIKLKLLFIPPLTQLKEAKISSLGTAIFYYPFLLFIYFQFSVSLVSKTTSQLKNVQAKLRIFQLGGLSGVPAHPHSLQAQRASFCSPYISLEISIQELLDSRAELEASFRFPWLCCVPSAVLPKSKTYGWANCLVIVPQCTEKRNY